MPVVVQNNAIIAASAKGNKHSHLSHAMWTLSHTAVKDEQNTLRGLHHTRAQVAPGAWQYWSGCPSHPSPPKVGYGLLHSRVWVPPHTAEHSDHSLQPPLTGVGGKGGRIESDDELPDEAAISRGGHWNRVEILKCKPR